MYNVCLSDIVSRELPCTCSRDCNSCMVFMFLTTGGLIALLWLYSSMVNLIRMWYPLMFIDLYDIWFRGN